MLFTLSLLCIAENSFVVCRHNISIVNDILFIEVHTMFLFTQDTIPISEENDVTVPIKMIVPPLFISKIYKLSPICNE